MNLDVHPPGRSVLNDLVIAVLDSSQRVQKT